MLKNNMEPDDTGITDGNLIAIELENILINKCIELFNKVVLKEADDNFYGKLPGSLVIEYKYAVRRTENHYKLTLKKRWKYSNHSLITESLAELDKNNPESGMYYERATALFYWDLERNKVFVNVTFGPRYARGYSYDLVKQDEKYMLDNEQLEWVS